MQWTLLVPLVNSIFCKMLWNRRPAPWGGEAETGQEHLPAARSSQRTKSSRAKSVTLWHLAWYSRAPATLLALQWMLLRLGRKLRTGSYYWQILFFFFPLNRESPHLGIYQVKLGYRGKPNAQWTKPMRGKCISASKRTNRQEAVRI